MKHIRILIAAVALLIAATMAAATPNRLFGHIKKTDGLTMVYISPAAMKLGLNMTDNFIADSKYAGLGKAISNPRGIEVLSAVSPSAKAMLRSEVDAAVEKLGMELFINASENGTEDVDIYIGGRSPDGVTVSNLLIVADEDKEYSVIYIGGDISTDAILIQ